MAQKEILDFLGEKRAETDNWFTIQDIREGLKNKGCCNSCIKKIYNSLYKLAAFNLIQVRGVGVWRHYKVFRGYKNGRA